MSLLSTIINTKHIYLKILLNKIFKGQNFIFFMSRIQSYFNSIDKYLEKAYSVAEKARKKGYDPTNFVEMPLAKGIAQRVEGLVSVFSPQILKSGVAQRVTELEEENYF